jgi:hypothetical protein
MHRKKKLLSILTKPEATSPEITEFEKDDKAVPDQDFFKPSEGDKGSMLSSTLAE